MHNYKQQIKKFIRKQGISYEFFDFFQSFFCLSFILQINLLTRTKFNHIYILLFIATARHTKKLPSTRQFFLTLWSWSPSCADGHNQHAAHYRDIASSSSYLRLGQAQISDLLCGWWPAFLSETSWSYRTDHHFLLMGRPVKENIAYLTSKPVSSSMAEYYAIEEK